MTTQLIAPLPPEAHEVFGEESGYYDLVDVKRGVSEIRDLYDVLEGRGYIAGSYAAWAAADDPAFGPGDVDIFLADDAQYGDVLEAVLRLERARYCEENDRVASITGEGLPIQIVRPSPEWKRMPWDILNSFDLDICRALILAPDRAVRHVNAGGSRAKILGVNNPPRSLARVIKYAKRGVEFNPWELLKLFRAWEALPFDRREAIVDRLRAEAFPVVESPPEGYSWSDDWFDAE